MRKITLPSRCVLSNKQELSGCDIIRRFVMVLPFWKNDSDLKAVNAFLDIELALDISETEPVVPDDAHSFLVRAMGLQNGMAQIQDPVTNRFYMQVFKSVLSAETLTESPGKKPG